MIAVSSKCKRKVCDVKRLFQDIWDEEYFVVSNKHGSATCVVCHESCNTTLFAIKIKLIKKFIAAPTSYLSGNTTRYRIKNRIKT